VRLALKVVMQNDRDFMDAILAHCGTHFVHSIQAATEA